MPLAVDGRETGCNNSMTRVKQLIVATSDQKIERSYCFLGGVWGTVCGHRNWNISAAKVACRQLGFSGARAAILSRALHVPFPNNYEIPIWWDGATCSGWETRLEVQCKLICSC